MSNPGSKVYRPGKYRNMVYKEYRTSPKFQI